MAYLEQSIQDYTEKFSVKEELQDGRVQNIIIRMFDDNVQSALTKNKNVNENCLAVKIKTGGNQ